jgi:hypothetical protein
MKRALFTFLAFATLTSVGGIYMESAQAQDFYDRSNIERRRGDYRRGYGDGVDCTNLYIQVGESFCEDTGGRSCGRIMGEIAANPHPLLRLIVEGELPRGLRVSSRTVSLAQDARACEGDRHGSFDRDIERDSENYHKTQGQERARERERHNQANTNSPREN